MQHADMSLACGRERDCVRAGDMARLAHLELKVACVEPILVSTCDTLLRLQQVFDLPLGSRTAPTPPSLCTRKLRAHLGDCTAYGTYARNVIHKTVLSARLLEGLLNLRHQSISLSLANATSDDSATVRVLTTITVIYLSSMAVAVSQKTRHPCGSVSSADIDLGRL